jgi:ABC-type antimicrobial peptide transport system permease subunit
MATQQWQIGKLKLKGDLVWSVAISSLRVRLGRAMLTVLTISTATAFLMYLLSMPGTDDPTDRQSWYLMLVLSMVVAAAGVLNTMIMSVTQRYREIGTIKCLGALDSLVLLSVLVEAALLGLIGSLIGVVIGSIIAFGLGTLDMGGAFVGVFFRISPMENDMIQWLSPLPVRLLFVFVVGMLLTTLGAAAPAAIAARMPPVEAMRGEK